MHNWGKRERGERVISWCRRCHQPHGFDTPCPFVLSYFWCWEFFADFAGDDALTIALHEAHIIPIADPFDDENWRLAARGGVLTNGVRYDLRGLRRHEYDDAALCEVQSGSC